MDEQLNLLIQLQELDSAMRALLEKKKKVPDALAALDRRRALCTADLEKVKENIQAAQKNKRDRDKDLDVGAQKVEKLKSRTSEIKTNKEYQALLKEIETAEQENKAIEDDILQLMEKIDSAASAIAGAEQRARQEEAGIQAEHKEIETANAQLEEELKSVEQAKQLLLERTQPAVLKQYQALLDTKAGIALAEARGETCSGCYMSIPPQVFVNVKKNESIVPCPQCGRILYFKEVIVQKRA
jgi:uncharacterized protein